MHISNAGPLDDALVLRFTLVEWRHGVSQNAAMTDLAGTCAHHAGSGHRARPSTPSLDDKSSIAVSGMMAEDHGHRGQHQVANDEASYLQMDSCGLVLICDFASISTAALVVECLVTTGLSRRCHVLLASMTPVMKIGRNTQVGFLIPAL